MLGCEDFGIGWIAFVRGKGNLQMGRIGHLGINPLGVDGVDGLCGGRGVKNKKGTKEKGS